MDGVLVGVLVYIGVQLGVGILVSRKVHSSQDYLLAGRRIGLGLGSFSMFATWFGAETCLGGAGRLYGEGLAGGATDPFGYFIALILMGLVFAAPLWRRQITTLADLFRDRFGVSTERFAACLMAPTSIFWAAGQIRAFGTVLHATSDLNLHMAITLVTAVVIVYTCFGGLLADVITDFFQGIALILGLVILCGAVALNSDLSLTAHLDQVPKERLRLFGSGVPLPEIFELWAVTILGSIVAQELVARAMGTRSPQIARNAALLGGGMYLVLGLIPAFLGLIGPGLLPDLENHETFLPLLAQQVLHPVLYVLLMGALVSAILSTVDSTLLASSSLICQNVLFTWKPHLPDPTRLLYVRIGVVLSGLAAYGLALSSESIHDLVMQANGMGSGGILVLVLAALFGRSLGGPRAAHTALALGFGVWAYGTWGSVWLTHHVPGLGNSLGGEWSCPYLISLTAATLGFLLVGWWERRTRKLYFLT